jgi:hypothetical protein
MKYSIWRNVYLTQEINSFNELEKIIRWIYDNRKDSEIDFISDELEDAYIRIDFTWVDGDPSTYIHLNNVYTRKFRSLDDILTLLYNELYYEN